MKTLIIYLIGVVCSYYVIKFYTGKVLNKDRSWDDILAGFLFSLFSWIMFIVTCFFMLCDMVTNNKSKPPKWL